MRKTLVLLTIGLVVGGLAVLGNVRSGDAAFHLMRLYGVMGGAHGNVNIQYVEMRMTDAGQNFVAGHDICFYDGTGAAYARFRFPTSVVNSADEASILVGTAEFDSLWPAGSPDFTFSAANTTAIQGGADVLHPVRAPAGKVAFGTDSQTTPSLMCQSGFTPLGLIDSVAYGTGYTGTTDFGTKLNSNLPTTGTMAARLQGPICFPGSFSSPCANPRDNSVDYALADVNTAGNNPRNNASQSGPISLPDSDGDGISDQTDNCPRWFNPAQNLPSWPVAMNDPDCDGFPTADETRLGTDPNDSCADTPAAGDEADDKWPADFDDSRFVSTLDLGVYASRLNTPVGNPDAQGARADLSGDGNVNTLDLGFFAFGLNRPCGP